MGHVRRRPKHLAGKLLAIREKLAVSRFQLAKLLEIDKGIPLISDYELGRLEPDLLVLLSYALLARVPMADLVNDKVELKFPRNWSPANKHEMKHLRFIAGVERGN